MIVCACGCGGGGEGGCASPRSRAKAGTRHCACPNAAGRWLAGGAQAGPCRAVPLAPPSPSTPFAPTAVPRSDLVRNWHPEVERTSQGYYKGVSLLPAGGSSGSSASPAGSATTESAPAAPGAASSTDSVDQY